MQFPIYSFRLQCDFSSRSLCTVFLCSAKNGLEWTFNRIAASDRRGNSIVMRFLLLLLPLPVARLFVVVVVVAIHSVNSYAISLSRRGLVRTQRTILTHTRICIHNVFLRSDHSACIMHSIKANRTDVLAQYICVSFHGQDFTRSICSPILIC